MNLKEIFVEKKLRQLGYRGNFTMYNAFFYWYINVGLVNPTNGLVSKNNLYPSIKKEWNNDVFVFLKTTFALNHNCTSAHWIFTAKNESVKLGIDRPTELVNPPFAPNYHSEIIDHSFETPMVFWGEFDVYWDLEKVAVIPVNLNMSILLEGFRVEYSGF